MFAETVASEVTTQTSVSKPTWDTILGWQEFGACRGEDPDIFFPDRGHSTRAAKEFCVVCVVKEECLEYAIKNGERHGIWGGTSERDRRKIRRQRGLPEVVNDISLDEWLR